MLCAIALLFAACRTSRPPDAEPLAPLTATSPSDAAQQLAVRRSQFGGERSLIRLRTSQFSARGQLQIDSSGRMLLTIYSPIGTSLARLYTDGTDLTFLNDFQRTAWRGKASDLTGTLAIFGGSVPLLLIGLPPPGLESITYGSAGIESFRLSDVTVRYDPPVYPPKRISIDRGRRHIEIEHLESYTDSAEIKALDIPSDYRCCVLPEM